MKTHQSNPHILSDELFFPGEFKFLVVGNKCRLLDNRRTPGVIENLNFEDGFFRWRILDFEDKGKFWDVAFEKVTSYQFKKEARYSDQKQIDFIIEIVSLLNKSITINVDTVVSEKTNINIQNCTEFAIDWLKTKSKFFKTIRHIDFQATSSPEQLRYDFDQYMKELNLNEIEQITAETQVLNPYSGEWIKGLQVVMAEMGLQKYCGPQIRSQNCFTGIGSKESRQNYILNRISFLRAMFQLLGINEVQLYRGMNSEFNWQTGSEKFWTSWTFNKKVAEDFSDLIPHSKFKNSYLLKRAIPINQLFMTYLETDAMNRQYLEAEAIVLQNEQDRMLW